MKYFLKRIGAFFEDSLGLSSFSANFKKFAAMHSSFNLFQGLVSVYISTLLMRVTNGDGDIVKWFNLLNYLFSGVMMPVAVVFVRKKSSNFVTRMGMVGFIVMYTTLLFTMSSSDKMMPVLGFLSGFSNAFYWLSYSTYVTAYTEDNRRDAALAFLGFVNGIITLIMPALSGFLIEYISRFAGGFVGYTVVFGLSFLIAVFTIILSLRLPKNVYSNAEKEKDRNTYFKKVLRSILVEKSVRASMASELIRGIREGTFNFLLNILLFTIISSETLMGINTLLVGLATILSYWVIGKIAKPGNRIKIMTASTVTLLIATLLPAYFMTPVGVIVFAVVNSFFSNAYLNSTVSITYLVIQKKAGSEAAGEYFSLKEVFLDSGRIIGILLFFIFPKDQLVAAIIFLTLTQFVALGFSRHTLKLLAKEDKEAAVHAESAEA